MAIRIAAPAPHGSHQAVAAYLSNPATRPFMEGIDFANAGASEPYPIYVATLDELIEGRLPKQPAYWRHLLVNDEGAVGEVDVTDEGGAEVMAVHQGPRAAGTVKALEAARALNGDYELRVLESPAIHLIALWLRGDRDMLVPIEPDFTGLPHHQPIALDEALATLRQRAAEMRRFEREIPGPWGS